MESKSKKFKLQNILSSITIAVVMLLMYSWLKPDANWQGVKAITGETKSVKLPDGSTAILKGPSQIGYPKVFEPKVRNVKVQGEISFEVINNGKNFVVQTEKGGVETRGAKFLVNIKEKKNITVHCLAGSLRMIAKGKKEILEIDLEENEMSSFTKGDKVIEKRPIDS